MLRAIWLTFLKSLLAPVVTVGLKAASYVEARDFLVSNIKRTYFRALIAVTKMVS